MAEENEQSIGRRALWSGNVTFGLVSIPVNLLPGNRSRAISLRMLARDGTPLRRRYFCPREERMLDADEIVRGYEYEPERYVVVTDEELEAVAPEKSREIDLRRFVPLDEVDRRYFNRAYLLAPAGDTRKAYLLLAEAMERNRRAGIATFVLHGKEHLVAILAERGILHAEMLHFADEIRTPAQLDLQAPAAVDPAAVKKLAARIRAARQDHLKKDVLKDPQNEQIQALVQEKQRSGRDMIEIAEADEPAEVMDEESGANVIDLMDILKRSLELSDRRSNEQREADPEKTEPEGDGRDIAALNTKELYALAQEKRIAGRSRMSRKALIKALQTR